MELLFPLDGSVLSLAHPLLNFSELFFDRAGATLERVQHLFGLAGPLFGLVEANLEVFGDLGRAFESPAQLLDGGLQFGHLGQLGL